MTGTFAGQAGVVTGATRGIGAAVAEQLALEGACVIAIGGRDAAAASGLERRLRAIGGEHLVRLADVSDREALMGVVNEARETFARPLSFAIANAGVWAKAPVGDVRDVDIDAMIDVHVKGTINTVQAVLPDMLAAGYGRLVTVSSIAGIAGSNFGAVPYAAAKAAIVGVTKSIAKELAPHGITANCIAPGAATEMFEQMIGTSDPATHAAYLSRFPLGLPTPEEVAPVPVFLASRAAGKTTGQVIAVDGGFLI